MSLFDRFAFAVSAASIAASCSAASPTESWTGAPLRGTFAAPTGLAYDASGGLYVTEWSAHRVTYISKANGRQLVTDRIPSPSGVVVGRDGVVYVSSYSEGIVYRLSSGGKPQAFVRGLHTPAGLSMDRDGHLLIADRGLNQILRADAYGKTTILAKDLATPVGAVEFSDGALVVSNFSGGVLEIRPDGRQIELTRQLGAPAVGIVAHGADAVLVPDYSGTSVWRVARSGAVSKLIEHLRNPVAMARSADGSEIAVGNWGDATIWRYRQGGMP